MKNINSFIGHLAAFTFIVLSSFIYGYLSQINPIPPLNVLIWLIYCYLIFKTYGEKKDSKHYGLKVIRVLSLIAAIYVIYLSKSVYYVAYFNEMYLSGTTSMIPIGFEEGFVNALFDPKVYMQKLVFLLSWDTLSISFGGNNTIAFGSVWTNTFRIIEIFGILCSPLMYRFLAKKGVLKSK